MLTPNRPLRRDGGGAADGRWPSFSEELVSMRGVAPFAVRDRKTSGTRRDKPVPAGALFLDRVSGPVCEEDHGGFHLPKAVHNSVLQANANGTTFTLQP